MLYGIGGGAGNAASMCGLFRWLACGAGENDGSQTDSQLSIIVIMTTTQVPILDMNQVADGIMEMNADYFILMLRMVIATILKVLSTGNGLIIVMALIG